MARKSTTRQSGFGLPTSAPPGERNNRGVEEDSPPTVTLHRGHVLCRSVNHGAIHLWGDATHHTSRLHPINHHPRYIHADKRDRETYPVWNACRQGKSFRVSFSL